MSVTTTCAPSAASRRATACPMPLPAAAVTSATRPANSPGSVVLTALLRQAEYGLGEDVALHLGGAGVDRPGPGVEEGTQPGTGGVRRTGIVGTHRAQRAAAFRHQPLQPLDVQGEFGRRYVVLAPEQFRDRGRRAQVRSVVQLGEDPVAEVAHDLDPGVAPGQALPDEGVA